MAVTVGWDNPEHTVLLYDFSETWTWEELFRAAQEDDSLLEGIEYTVHQIFDMQKTRMIPSNPLARMENLAHEIRPTIGLMIFVGGTLWFQTIVDIFHNFFLSRIADVKGLHFVKSVDEGRAIIAQYGLEQVG